ncbi:ABC transporter ATP-binding protein [Erwinia sp. V71]|uniref:ABC transporter ATP-binding protein n=1 Tax=Erwinia sp. V71 TaxID=3369424 RepID=UPI003F612E91
MKPPLSSVAARLDAVGFRYGASTVLDNVSFSVRRGEFLAIVGPNGCGKSTALKLLAGLLKPAGGQVLIDEQPLASFSRRQLARRMALLTQFSGAPEGMTVADLVHMGRYSHESWLRRQTEEDCRQVQQAMQRMAVADLAQRRLGDLSGGQLQRVRMAMTLAQDAQMLLLDEPTNHLDLKHQYALLDVARDEARAGRAVVAVLHDLTQATLYADRLVLLHRGNVENSGTPRAVLTSDAIEKVWDIRTRAIDIGDAVIHIPQGAG